MGVGPGFLEALILNSALRPCSFLLYVDTNSEGHAAAP